MQNLENFTRSALIEMKGVLEERENYYIFRTGKDYNNILGNMQECIISLDGEWMYKPCDYEAKSMEEQFYSENYIGPGFTPVIVPGAKGVGGYIKKFQLSRSRSYCTNYLLFKGIHAPFYLWVNGEFVGYNKEGNGTNEFDVTRYLKAGVNTVSILMLKNDRKDVDPLGMWDSVCLITRPEQHIWNFRMDTLLDEECCHMAVTLKADYHGGAVYTKCMLFDPNGRKVVDEDLICGETSFVITNPMLWSAEKPMSYMLMLVTEEETLVKEIGLCERKVVEGSLMMNRQVVSLNVVACWHNPDRFVRAVGKNIMLLELTKMKEKKINAIYLGHCKADARLSELCRKMGFYIINNEELELEDVPEWDLLRDSNPEIQNVNKEGIGGENTDTEMENKGYIVEEENEEEVK